MKHRKSICIMLLVSLLLGMVGCGTDSAEETVPAEQTQTSAVEETAETGYPAPDFKGLDFKGENLSVITPRFHFYSYYIADELTGESVNDAVYNRTVNTENALNVDVTVNQDYSDSETHNVVGQSIMAGDDAWHIVFTHSLFGVNTYVIEDQLYNMEALPYVDFAAPWWDQKSIEYFKIGDEVYYGRGDLVLTTTEVTLFNKDIAEDYQLPDHYEMVRQGKWTYDTFLSEVNMVSEDLNGDGAITYEDKVGFTAELTERLCGLPFSFGIHLSEVTENGLEFTFWNEKYMDLYSKTLALITDTAHSQAFFRGATPADKRLLFSSGNALFTFVDGGEIVGLRDVEMDFGVLPMPKYDENQENYCCYAWPTFVCVPTTIQNVEKVGAGLECFAYESQPVMKAYMMDLLRGKAARDEESVEMFDLIYDSQVIDIAASYLGFNPNTNKFFYMWSNNISGKKDSIASEYEKYKQAAEAELADLYETIINNQANH